MEDLKEKIEAIVKKLEADPNLLNEFKADPAAAIKNVIGIDIPEESINSVITAVKGKLLTDDVKEEAEGILKKIEGIFEKK